ncbi:MAG: FecR domain-containing protein [Rhodocyclaceae bacterium]|nr:FecR domain-containing protein [Rhodocyclaceae bacterium]
MAAVTGDVTADDRKIAAGADVGGGTRIATGTGSFATIELVDGSRLVLPDSRIKLDELSRHRYAETTETRLSRTRPPGIGGGQVTPRARPHFSVIMPTATVGVRGTRFRVAAEAPGSASRAEVTDGTVAVGDGGKGHRRAGRLWAPRRGRRQGIAAHRAAAGA